MNLLAPVSTIMTKNVRTVEASDSLRIVGKVFDMNDIHHLPVMEANDLVGIISKSDFYLFKSGVLK